MLARRDYGMARNDSRRGVVLLTAAGMMFVLLAFVGLAFDVGYLQWSRRRAQTAADAAAIAGAWAGMQGEPVTTAGQNSSADNGFKDSTNGVTVTINKPPSGGSYSTDPTAVEAIVSQDAPSFFMQVLGVKILPVRARAVAKVGYSVACLYALNPTVKDALTIVGTSTMNLGCGGVSESNDPKSIDINGNTAINLTNGASLGAVGNYSACTGCVNPSYALDSGIISPGDPLSTLPMPTYSSQPCFDQTSWSMASGVLCTEKTTGAASGTYQPGVYCGGITINSGVDVNFSPGMYVLAGGTGLTINAGRVRGNGVTFYFTDANGWPCKGVTGSSVDPGALSVSNSADVAVTAPTSGAYAGMLFFGNRFDTTKLSNNHVNGGTNFVIDGAIYFPHSALSFSGSSDPNGYMLIIADTITFTGNSTLTLNNMPPEFASNNPAFKQWVSAAE
jgi:Putative Flp pilus-assembly TadE/G-like